MTKFTHTELFCKCGASNIIKCFNHRDYSNWLCRSCSIKKLWDNEEYRKSRLAKQKPKNKKPKLTKAEIAAKISKSSSGRKLSEKHIEALTGRKLTKEHKEAMSKAISNKWLDEQYRNKQIKRLQESKEQRSKTSAKLWEDPEFAAKYRTQQHRDKASVSSKNLWNTPEYRDKVLKAKSTDEFKAKMAKIQSDPEYIKKLSLAAANLPKVSSIQECLYGILDDLNIKYYREYNDRQDDPECIIGPWSFDCVIPRKDNKTLLIECNGDWIHSLPDKKKSDKAKYTYINKYMHDYEIKTLWEHEFYNLNKIIDNIKYWLNITDLNKIDFNFADVKIKKATPDEYKVLLSKYHYLSNAGRGGIAYGAYLDNSLIAVCVFSPLPRQNIADQSKSRDLSRFCINPIYQKKNFGSWFISRCIKMLPDNYTTIVAYADKTFNHNGTIYKASNFKLDSIVPADYWYTSKDGWVMHKKTLYNRASNIGLTESDYATKFEYIKTHGDIKYKYIYIR